MKTQALNHRTALQLNGQHTLRNRVVVPPMASGTATLEGFVTQETLKHYAALAASEAGLVIVEYSFVHPSGRSEENQLGISSEAHVRGLTRLAEAIKQKGAVAGIQLTHAGGKSNSTLTDGKLMGPSSIAVPVKDQLLEIPIEMSLPEIELWKQAFLEAADRAVQAGFDLVEFHSAHGYGLNQWLSPITNLRNDKYGKDSQGRMRLLRETIRLVREKHPGLLISVRIPGQDFLENGLKIQEAIEIARELEKSGVNLIHVSSGIGGWRRPASRTGEGYLVNEAAEIQSQVSIPVIGVGGIETAEYIDKGLRSGRFSLAAVGRAILKDPKAWGTTLKNGAQADESSRAPFAVGSTES